MRRVALILALVGIVVGLAGCGETVSPAPETVVGTVETPPPPAAGGDATAGKQVFADAGCASCHALADAGASGTIGPSLDETKPALELVIDRVTNGKGGMPPFGSQLSETQIADVAAYVVEATAG